MIRALAVLSIVVLSGRIITIDYLREKMLLAESRNRTATVYILPSTNIVGKNDGYHTIADLKKGAHVEVYTSVRGTRTDAEIIKLL